MSRTFRGTGNPAGTGTQVASQADLDNAVADAEAAETAAVAAQGAAEAAQNAAETAETNAGASETASAASEAAAAASETASGISETNSAASEAAAGTSETNAAASAVATAADAVDTAADVTYAEEWAIKPEDQLISVAAGGDGVSDYSALHWAAKAENAADYYTKAESDANFAPKKVNGGTLATTSGRSVEWSSIPSWVTRIVVAFNSVGTDGVTDLLGIQIGDSGGFETTGYDSSSLSVVPSAVATAVSTSTSDFVLWCADSKIQGLITLEKTDGNSWVSSGVLAYTTTTTRQTLANGTKTLSGTLDRVKVLMQGSTNDFDAGSITLLYE